MKWLMDQLLMAFPFVIGAIIRRAFGLIISGLERGRKTMLIKHKKGGRRKVITLERGSTQNRCLVGNVVRLQSWLSFKYVRLGDGRHLVKYSVV